MSDPDESPMHAPPSGPISVFDVLMAMTDQLAAFAWQKLGLQPDPFSRKVQVDLAEAKVAIDVTTHLASFIQPRLDESDRRQMENLIRDLRINYVEKSKEGVQ